jgi:serine phosphatase RsbU (regulator of sigma subunit)
MYDNKIKEIKSNISMVSSLTEKVDSQNKLAFALRNSSTKQSIALSKKAQKIALQINYTDGYATALCNEAFCYVQITDYKLALEKLFLSLQIFEKNENENGIAQVSYNFCLVYVRLSEYSLALDNINKALSYNKKINDKEETARCFFQLGFLYYSLNEFNDAIAYYQKGVALGSEIGNKAIEVSSMMGLGLIYTAKKEYIKSGDILLKCINIREEIKDWRGYAAALHAYMTLCFETEKYEEAKEIAYKGIKLERELGDKMGIASFLLDLGKIQFTLNDIDEAEKTILEALEIAMDIDYKKIIAPAHFFLSKIYESCGNFANALKHHKEYHNANLDLQNTNALIKVKHIELLAKMEAVQKEAEINRLKNVELKNAFDVIEQKNKDILKSLTYAKRIQKAILPSLSLFKKYVESSFVLHIPKDIVAGDFYWIENIDNKIFFAACDCTGHGVPGALVSIICNNALNRALNEFGERLPGKIFDKTRELLLDHFDKSDEEVNDGMDASLAVIDMKNRVLLWSGSNIPLWIIKGSSESADIDEVFIEIKADKQPISKGYKEKPFTTHEIKLQEGDIIYLFTDGYADQFGGEIGKKMKKAKFREKLMSIAHLPMHEQHQELHDFFNQYKGDYEQLDDVCIIGVAV